MTIHHGDSLEIMRTMEDNCISCILTDPPYGLKFMGKAWDHGIPGIEYWAEMIRICKPGSMMLAFGGTRTFHRLTCSIEDAGWEIRDCLMWIYGSGFPKSHNKFGLDGYGTALKPSWEPIIMAMKSLDGTYKQNVEKWEQGGINIDECRIGEQQTITCMKNLSEAHGNKFGKSGISYPKIGEKLNPPGRWPANTLFDEQAAEMLDQQSGILKSGAGDKHGKTQLGGYEGGFKPMSGVREYKADSGGASRFFFTAKYAEDELLFCRAKTIMEEWKPNFANIADENFSLPREYVDSVLKNAVIKASQEGKLLKDIIIPSMTVTVKELRNLCLSVIIMTLSIEKKYWHGSFLLNMGNWKESPVNSVEIQKLTDTTTIMTNPMNSYGYVVNVILMNMSEYLEHGEKDFPIRFNYCAKASSAERNGSTHPTIKPLKLTEYLLKLIMPPNGIVLDPFMGSGTTLVAAKNLGMQAIGIEKEVEYIDIAKKRITL